MNVCIAVPKPGTYAVAVRHDVDGDNAKRDWVGNGVKPVRVILNYKRGLSIGPASRS